MGKYDPKQIEPKWQIEWEKNPSTRAVDFDSKPKYYVLTEFPYPSGEGLHLGHVLNYTTPDVYTRKKRMEGKNVLFPMGWDAFGLPTENYAVKTGIQPAVVTKRNTDNFRSQMKAMAFSFDWDREINTTDPNYVKWTQWIFLQLFKNGLAYKSATPVGWCPSCKIVLANEEIVNDKCERCGTLAQEKVQSQWVLRITSYADRLDEDLASVDYPESVKLAQHNWIGKKVGVKIKFGDIEVFTTRPDTIYGATFIVLAPEHPLAQKFKVKRSQDLSKEKTGIDTGLKVINPVTKKEIPVWISDYVLAQAGTGAIMGVPAHDERDLDFANKFNLPVIKVIEKDDTLINSDIYNGLKSNEAFEKITKELENAGIATRTTTYHLRDWIFSRQHYWGEPIPMIYCETCAKKGKTFDFSQVKPLFNPIAPEHFDSLENPVDLAGWFPVSEDDLPLTLPKVDKYQPTDTGESPLANITSWVETKCPNCGGPARRETDTMPNWAGSSWYYLRFTDPDNDALLADPKRMDYWQPVDVYFGGPEHVTLHLLYSRFWHKFLYDLGVAPGTEPYKARRQHGMLLAEDGSKMSKSKGNVINPDDVILKYGVDTLRTYISFMGPYDQTLSWNTAGVEGIVRFLNRVWDIYHSSDKIAKKTSLELAVKLNWTIKHSGDAIDNLKQNTGIAGLMEFLNMWGDSNNTLDRQDAEKYIRLLAPFAPHLAEELWHELGNEDSVHSGSWPKYDDNVLNQGEKTLAVSINGKTRSTLVISAQESKALTQDEVVQKAKIDTKLTKHLEGKHIKAIVYVPGKVLNFVI